MAPRPREDYWTAGERFPLIQNQNFTGSVGLQQLSAPTMLTAANPERFRARLSRLQLDHVALEAFEATAHRGDVPMTDSPEPACGAVCITLMLDGHARVTVDGAVFEVQPGDITIADSRDALQYSVPEHFTTLRCVVGLQHLPPTLQLSSNTHRRALRPSPMTKSLFSFINAMLGDPEQITATSAPALIAALIDLQVAVLHEASRRGDRDSPEDLRARMLEHIDLHLQEPDLDPTAVADAVGISARSAHALFQDAERTIAREIRERRLRAVARDLRTTGRPRSVAALADRWGFSGPDVLTRAFRHRYGLTPWQYRDTHHHGP